LQHQDGHSHLVANTIPTLKSYDPAFAFEIALLVREGIRRMYQEQEDLFYYLTLTNQAYPMPPMPDGVEQGVLKGMYCFERNADAVVNLLGSGAIMSEVLRAQSLLAALGVTSNIWSVTSYNELSRQGLAAERAALLGVGDAAEQPFVAELLGAEDGVFVAASDYQKALAMSISRWVPEPYAVLGTDGFGLSEDRDVLREYFEVSAEWIAFAALSAMAQSNRSTREAALAFADQAGLDLNKLDPARA
jgi:pyruvate dehydrogenase E1 component